MLTPCTKGGISASHADRWDIIAHAGETISMDNLTDIGVFAEWERF
jgi:hypothetical protein